MMWYGDHMSGWGWALMAMSTLIFWSMIIAGIVVLVRYLNRSEQRGNVQSVVRARPEHVLAERFARGEIDEAEFHRRLDTLFASGSTNPTS